MNRFFRSVLAVLCCVLSASPHAAMAGTGTGWSLSDRVLAAHNAERGGLGLPPLAWSEALAREAAEWAEIIAREGRLRHATQWERSSHGENLWMGTSGAFPIEVMIGAFLEERRHFRPGKFPDISTTGRWQDAAHYTQVIWPRTSEVGCAVVTSRGYDFLVCRYDPGGNWFGQPVG